MVRRRGREGGREGRRAREEERRKRESGGRERLIISYTSIVIRLYMYMYMQNTH